MDEAISGYSKSLEIRSDNLQYALARQDNLKAADK